MDVRLFMRVLWRFRFLTALGVALALGLAVLSFANVEFKGGSIKAHYRGEEKWISRSTVLVTERRFPLGRAVLNDAQLSTSALTQPIGQAFAPSSRFTELASIYAELATSDAVGQYIRKDGLLAGKIQASALTTLNSDPLPILEIDAISSTPTRAATLARRATGGLRSYIEVQQRESGTPVDERVVLAVIKRPLATTATLDQGRSKTMPIVVFLVVMFGIVALEFLLENIRPQIRAVPAEQEPAAVEAARARLLA